MKVALRRLTLSALAFPTLLCVLLIGAWFFRDVLYSVFSSSERLREAVARFGAWGPLVFVALQAVQVIVFILPGEIAQMAGGYLFGVLNGTLLSVTGIAIGSVIDFALARTLGKRFVAALSGSENLERFDRIRTSPRAEAVFFLLFVIPGIPKDLLCFVAGLSAMRPLGFLAVSMVGRLPGIVGSSVMGAAAADGRGGLFVGVGIVALALFVAGFLGRDRIHEVLSALAVGARRSARGGPPEVSSRPGESASGERELPPEAADMPRTKDT